MCRDRLPTKNQDLAGFGQNRGQDWGEMWPDGFSQGPPRAGIQLGGGVSVSGCVSGPCWAILGHGGSVRGHFPYFRGIPYFPDYFSYYYRCGWPIITGVAGLLLPVWPAGLGPWTTPDAARANGVVQCAARAPEPEAISRLERQRRPGD